MDPKHYPLSPYRFPASIEEASEVSNLAPALLRRGYSEADARKILGKYFLYVFHEVWTPDAGNT